MAYKNVTLRIAGIPTKADQDAAERRLKPPFGWYFEKPRFDWETTRPKEHGTIEITIVISPKLHLELGAVRAAAQNVIGHYGQCIVDRTEPPRIVRVTRDLPAVAS